MTIVIAAYDPAWPRLFAREAARIAEACGERVVAIEHVGSTAVPGLAAKPIIDIMPGVRALADADACIGAMVSLGYEYVSAFEDALPERRYFRRYTDGVRSHHVHMVELGGSFWERHLLFRDYLRAHREVAMEYEQLKRDLARIHEDTVSYADAKTDFIQSVEGRARRDR